MLKEPKRFKPVLLRWQCKNCKCEYKLTLTVDPRIAKHQLVVAIDLLKISEEGKRYVEAREAEKQAVLNGTIDIPKGKAMKLDLDNNGLAAIRKDVAMMKQARHDS